MLQGGGSNEPTGMDSICVAFFKLLKKLPVENQKELYFMSEGAKLIIENETA